MSRKPNPTSVGDEQQHSDTWSRFEHAVDVVAKSPPQHKVKPKKRREKKQRSTKSGKS
jgi:hypothetical protein